LWLTLYNEAYVYRTKPNEFFREQLSQLKHNKILLPAEGEGRNTVFAAKNGWLAEAFDLSAAGREKH